MIVNDNDTLILDNIKYVRSFAYKYKDFGVSLEDLIQEGIIGLIKARNHFDPNRGVKFITFAIYWVREAIQNYFGKNCTYFTEYHENYNPTHINIEQHIDDINRLDYALTELDKVNPRNKEIMISRRIYEIPYKDLAKKYGVSMERIRQLEVNCVNKLKR